MTKQTRRLKNNSNDSFTDERKDESDFKFRSIERDKEFLDFKMNLSARAEKAKDDPYNFINVDNKSTQIQQ